MPKKCPSGLAACLEECRPPADCPPVAGEIRVDAGSGLAFVWTPPGEVVLGCVPSESGCIAGATASRSVKVAGFWLAKTEVTVEAYGVCVYRGSCTQPDGGEGCNAKDRPLHPVNCVDYKQALTYCTWIKGRLPTAIEFEHAAKGGESRVYPWGNQPVTGRRANFCDKNCRLGWRRVGHDDGWAQTAPVGSFPEGASKWGVLDLAGNVREWTSTNDAQGNKELRGGGWFGEPNVLTSSYGIGNVQTLRTAHAGFRCVLDQAP